MITEYDDPQRGREFAERTREFLDEVVVPKERSLAGGADVSRGTIRELRDAAREYGVYAPQIA